MNDDLIYDWNRTGDAPQHPGRRIEFDDEQLLSSVEARLKAAHGPQRYQPMVVQVDLDRDEADKIAARLHLLAGVDLERVPHRNYRTHEALAHVLGYMNEVTQEELLRLNGR